MQKALQSGGALLRHQSKYIFNAWLADRKPCAVMKYLHAPHVTVPLRATDHTAGDVLICEQEHRYQIESSTC